MITGISTRGFKAPLVHATTTTTVGCFCSRFVANCPRMRVRRVCTRSSILVNMFTYCLALCDQRCCYSCCSCCILGQTNFFQYESFCRWQSWVCTRRTARCRKIINQRYFLQVDIHIVQEASERRVAPGTPIHSLRKRLKRTEPAKRPASPKQHKPVVAGPAGPGDGAPASHLTARAQAKGKAAVAARVPGHVNGISRSLDAARTKEVSDYLKSQISEANMLLEVGGIYSTGTLISAVVYCCNCSTKRFTFFHASRRSILDSSDLLLLYPEYINRKLPGIRATAVLQI